MIINRIAPRGPAAADGGVPPLGDFYVLVSSAGSAYVTAAVAREIARALDRRFPPRWIVFRDRVGSRIRVRTSEVRVLAESTAAQRAGDRMLARARLIEEALDQQEWEDSL